MREQQGSNASNARPVPNNPTLDVVAAGSRPRSVRRFRANHRLTPSESSGDFSISRGSAPPSRESSGVRFERGVERADEPTERRPIELLRDGDGSGRWACRYGTAASTARDTPSGVPTEHLRQHVRDAFARDVSAAAERQSRRHSSIRGRRVCRRARCRPWLRGQSLPRRSNRNSSRNRRSDLADRE
jgi:hypothetical protein